MNQRLGLLLGECNAVNHYVRAKTPKIISRPIELVSIPLKNAGALWQVHGAGSAMKNRHLMPGSEQSVGNRKSEETRSPQNQYAQGFSLPPVLHPGKRRSIQEGVPATGQGHL